MPEIRVLNHGALWVDNQAVKIDDLSKRNLLIIAHGIENVSDGFPYLQQLRPQMLRLLKAIHVVDPKTGEMRDTVLDRRRLSEKSVRAAVKAFVKAWWEQHKSVDATPEIVKTNMADLEAMLGGLNDVK